MTVQEVLDVYAPLDNQEKVVFLAISSHALTIAMRCLYDSVADTSALTEQF